MSNSVNDRKKEKIIVSPKKSPYTITCESNQNNTGNQNNSNIVNLVTNLDNLKS